MKSNKNNNLERILLVEDNFSFDETEYVRTREEGWDYIFELKEKGVIKNPEEKEKYSKELGEKLNRLKEKLINKELKNLEKITGYKIDFVNNVEEAIEELNNKKYEIVITDLGLPLKKGQKRFNNDDYNNPVIKKLREESYKNKDKVIGELNKNGLLSEDYHFKSHLKEGTANILNRQDMYSGTIISKLAKEKKSKVYITTDIGHHAFALLGAMIAGEFNVNEYKNIYNQLEKDNSGSIGLKKGDIFVKSKDTYVGRKADPEFYKKVILDIANQNKED